MSWIWLLGICYRIDFVYTAFFCTQHFPSSISATLGLFLHLSNKIAINPFINPDWGSFSSQSISTSTETETETEPEPEPEPEPETENEKIDAASTRMLQSRGMLQYEVICGRAY